MAEEKEGIHEKRAGNPRPSKKRRYKYKNRDHLPFDPIDTRIYRFSTLF